MAVQTKADLLALDEKDFAKLKALLSDIDEKTALTPHPDDGVTIKDTVLHRAHWLGLFLKWRRDGAAGKEVHTPAPGYKWNQLKAYNARIRETYKDVAWPDAVKRLAAARAKFVKLIESLDEEELYGPKKYDWTNNWTLGRWAEASGPSHYRSAIKYIREIRRKTS
ncbi:MAG: ClbS/DfsB family four-helix bundle protein [Pseudomonadota bacterium]